MPEIWAHCCLFCRLGIWPLTPKGHVVMATKAGDDPESLMSLCTVFCLKNLRRTMCYTGERNKLCLRPDIFLPSEICDKLVNVYVHSFFKIINVIDVAVLARCCIFDSEGVRAAIEIDNDSKLFQMQSLTCFISYKMVYLPYNGTGSSVCYYYNNNNVPRLSVSRSVKTCLNFAS